MNSVQTDSVANKSELQSLAPIADTPTNLQMAAIEWPAEPVANKDFEAGIGLILVIVLLLGLAWWRCRYARRQLRLFSGHPNNRQALYAEGLKRKGLVVFSMLGCIPDRLLRYQKMIEAKVDKSVIAGEMYGYFSGHGAKYHDQKVNYILDKLEEVAYGKLNVSHETLQDWLTALADQEQGIDTGNGKNV